MMNQKYLGILRELAAWRIVPGLKPGREGYGKLKAQLGGVPCHVAINGDLVIGVDSQAALPVSGICLLASLPGAGGVLKTGRDGKFLFSEVSGFGPGNSLLGRKLGAYKPTGGDKICELEVERSHLTPENNTLYFLPGQEDIKAVEEAGSVVVTHPAAFEASADKLCAWNLSSLANAALLIYLLREISGLKGLIGVLRLGENDGPAGLFPVELNPIKNPAIKQDFGYVFNFPGEVPGAELRQDAEGVSVPPGAAGLAAGIRVENQGNWDKNESFTAEALPAGRLESYIALAESLVRSLADPQTRLPARSGAIGSVTVSDELPEIARLVAGARDFADFLASGMPKITEIYNRHGLVSTAVKASSFETLRQSLKAGGSALSANVEQVQAWAAECVSQVRGLMPALPPRDVKIVTILMLPVPSASSADLTVFLSPDKIEKGKLKETLFGELSSCLARSALRDFGLPRRLVRHYSEGVRYALLAAMSGRGLAETMGFSPEKFAKFSGDSKELRDKLNTYLSGELLYLYEGKYHRYFKDRELYDPYAVFYGTEGGYGRFLAAVEVSELLAAGNFNEKILSY